MYWRCCDYKRPLKGMETHGGFPSDQRYKVRVLNYQIWVRGKKKKKTSVKVTFKCILTELTFSLDVCLFSGHVRSLMFFPPPKSNRPALVLRSCRRLVMAPGTRARMVCTHALRRQPRTVENHSCLPFSSTSGGGRGVWKRQESWEK